MRTNIHSKSNRPVTHEGAPAVRINSHEQLTRSVMACFLWEDTFYEDGESIADRIVNEVKQCDPAFVAALAVRARSEGNLRHVPLLLIVAMLKAQKEGVKMPPGLLVSTIKQTIQRADELAEIVSIYAKINGKVKTIKPLPNALKKGLREAFSKFSAYNLAKYNRDGPVKLRDVLFLSHAKPRDENQAETFKKLVDKSLESPDTWEVALSGGADKKETFERLISEGKLGYFALLRNLRNMQQAGVDESLVRYAVLARKNGAERILPFRFIAAARAVPQWEPFIDEALLAQIKMLPTLPGKTIVLVDVSGSMDAKLSMKSDMKRVDAAAALASIVKCENLQVFAFDDNVREVPPRRGMAGVDAITRMVRGGTNLGYAVGFANNIPHDRLIVITDEQSHDRVPAPRAKHAYLINVASYQNGVGYRNGWTHIDGFSESILRYVHAHESGTLFGGDDAQSTSED